MGLERKLRREEERWVAFVETDRGRPHFCVEEGDASECRLRGAGGQKRAAFVRGG